MLAAEAFVAAATSPSQSTETLTFGLWSIPLAAIVAFLALRVRRTWGEFALAWRALGSAVAGIALGVAYAFAAYFLSGGWVLAFGFPVLYCWVIGAVAGLVVGCLVRANV
jgi:hypothetical protein